MKAWGVLALIVATACARGGSTATGGDASVGSPADAPATSDAHVGGTVDAASDAGGGLDPDLSLPDPSGQVCHAPGAIGSPECPPIQVCRYFSPSDGRCESCSDCGNLDAACTATNQCDILFECYQGRCTNFCTLGSSECGAVADCVDIGYPGRGVCKP